jgi:hypothetical protein
MPIFGAKWFDRFDIVRCVLVSLTVETHNEKVGLTFCSTTDPYFGNADYTPRAFSGQHDSDLEIILWIAGDVLEEDRPQKRRSPKAMKTDDV